MRAEQYAQGRFVVRIAFGGRRRGIGGRHPVTGLEQRRGRHQAGPADQPLELGVPELRPLAGQRLRAVAADQRERDPGGRDRAHHVAGLPPRFHLAGEHGQFGRVQPVAVQQVTVVAMLDPVAPQDRAQPAHQDRQLILGPGGRGGVPQRVDQHVGRHGLPGGYREQLQREPRLPAAQRLRLDSVHAEIAEHPHGQRLHAGIKSRRRSPPGQHRQVSTARVSPPVTARWLQPPSATLGRRKLSPMKGERHDLQSGAEELRGARRDPRLRAAAPWTCSRSAAARSAGLPCSPDGAGPITSSRWRAPTCARRRISSTTWTARCTS